MLAFLLHAAQAEVVEAPVPDWVVPIDVGVDVPPPTGASLAAMQFLLCDDQTWLHDDGGASRYVRRAYRIVTHEGLESGGRVEIAFDPDTEDIALHDVSVYRDGHWSDRLEDAHTALIQPEADLWQGLLSGRRNFVMLVAQLAVGDVVRYAYTIRTHDPVFDGHYFDSYAMGWSDKVAERYLLIRTTPDRPLAVRAHGVSPGVTADETLWNWHLRDVPSWPVLYGVPAEVLGAPFVQASEYRTWSEVVDWAVPLYELNDLGGLSDVVWDLEQSGRDYETAALDFVQDEIRYLGLELGEGSHVPRQPGAVLGNRYGDCKDKTLLFIALLREAGIQAWPALVSSEGHPIDTWAPSPGAFDHVIVYVEDAQGGHWVDPTYRLQGGAADQRHTPSYGKALLVRPGEGWLVDVAPARVGRSEVTWHYTVDAMLSPTLETTTVAHGMRADNLRSWFASTSQDALSEQLRAQLERSGESLIPLDPPGVVDDREGNVVELKESYRVVGAWQPDLDGAGEIFPLYELALFNALPYPEPNRMVQLALPLGLDEQDTVILDVPDDWVFEDRTGEVENEWFRFTVETHIGHARVRETTRLQVLSDRVDVHDLAAYQAAVDEVWAWSGYTLTRDAGYGWDRPGFAEGFGWGLGIALGIFFPAGLGMGLLAAVVLRRRRT